jgi:signal peptidase I
MIAMLLAAIAGVVVEIGIIKVIQQPSILRAAAAWGITLIGRGALIAAALLLIRPFLTQAYTNYSLSMAPTLMSNSLMQKCPSCGGDIYFNDDVTAPRLPGSVGDLFGICQNCREEFHVPRTNLTKSVRADRFFAARTLTPRRWDVILFHYKTQIYAKRLIGLPGETVSIDAAGGFSIDGRPVSPPAGAPSKFRWPPDLEIYKSTMKLPPGEFLKLGHDEYFVIGDLSERSSDSRFFGPIKTSDTIGVVDFVYAPLSRIRILR